MVLESLTSPKRAEKSPWDLLFIGALYAAVALFLSVWVFREEASLVMVLLTVMVSIPLIFNTMKYEEKKDHFLVQEKSLLKEHSKALSFFMFLFVGFVLAFSLAYILLPHELVQDVFDSQLRTIQNINSRAIDDVSGATIGGFGLLLQILANNLKVMLFAFFFSFFYGAGAIFILTWNASVISAAIGTFFRNNIAEVANGLGFSSLAGYFQVYSLSLLRYFIHGLPEILGYFIGGLAGGLISVAVIKHDFGTFLFRRVLRDSFDLVLLAVVVLTIAAFMEVYVTPLFF